MLVITRPECVLFQAGTVDEECYKHVSDFIDLRTIKMKTKTPLELYGFKGKGFFLGCPEIPPENQIM